MIGFATPLALLWGLSLAGIIILYLLKRQGKPQIVPSLYLWRRAAENVNATRPFQKLKKSLVMLLQLLTALIITLGLARPFFSMQTASDIVLIIDASASMQAAYGNGTRFSAAQREALLRTDSLLPGQSASVIWAGPNTQTLAPITSDRLALKRAIDGMEASGGTGSLGEAVALAKAASATAQIIVYTDAPFSAEGVAVVPVGQPASNRAVTRIACAKGVQNYSALVVVSNFGEETDCGVELWVDGNLYISRLERIAANEIAYVTFDGIPQDAWRVEARLSEPDSLPLDDSITAFLSGERRTRVLLVTEGNRFLETALMLRDDVELFVTPPESAGELSGYALYVFDGAVPAELPRDGSLLLIAAPGEEEGGALQAERDSPLLSHVRLDTVRVRAHTPIDLPISTLATLNGQPAIQAGEWEGRPTVAVSFDIHDSNWPMAADFPIFLQNVLGWAAPGVSAPAFTQAGQTVPLAAMPGTVSAAITSPSGKGFALSPTATSFSQADEVGAYTLSRVTGDGETITEGFMAHVPFLQESDLRSAAQAQLGDAASGTVAGRGDLMRWLAVFALLIMCVEWGFSHRG